MPVEMDELLNTFLDEADEHLAALESGLLRVGDGPPDLELLNAVFRAAHSLKGGSGVFGFDAITRLTHALEQLLDRLRKGQLPTTRDRIDLLLRAVDGLNGMFAAARAGQLAAEAPEEMVRELNAAAGVEHRAVVHAAVIAAPTGLRVYRVAVTPGPGLLTDGMDPLLLLRNLGKRGDVLEVTAAPDAIPDLAHIDPTRCYLSWVVTIRTEESPDALKDVFRFVADDCAVEVTEHATGDDSSHITVVGASLAEYEATYGQLIDWVVNRMPVLRALAAAST
ncbi:Hpt domain-containing protein [Gemmata sp. G18]|uniref:Hpt domain-containing protein n=1 Tax=Gemmata palustris TaxID=2822762 RepID=A0ABS5BSQ8_9BACT|nr:Hpt domain-containing protein [Gemmata palustris]MBP3956734.1 Hpt domain-containing protein [Gemmata palustris]